MLLATAKCIIYLQGAKRSNNMLLTNRTLIIFKYLWEKTDEPHPVSLADISGFLKQHENTTDPSTLRKASNS